MKSENTSDDDFDVEAFFEDAVKDMPDDPPRPVITPMIERKPVLRLRPPLCNIPDALTSDFLEPALVDLEASFGLYRARDSESKRSLWELLGGIYELAEKVLGNENARAELVGLVKRIEEVKESTRWGRPETKHPRELLVVQLLGLNERTKATKSNWLKALKAAEECNIEKTKIAFVDWISEIGGIEGARKLYAKPRAPKPPTQIEDILASINLNDDEQMELPMSFWGKEREDGLSLMLVKHCSGDVVVPIFSFAGEKQIIAIWDAHEKHGRKIERELGAELESNRKKFDRERLSKIKAEFKKAIKQGRTRLTFDEFRDEFEGEHPLTHEEERIRWMGGGNSRPAISYGPMV